MSDLATNGAVRPKIENSDPETITALFAEWRGAVNHADTCAGLPGFNVEAADDAVRDLEAQIAKVAPETPVEFARKFLVSADALTGLNAVNEVRNQLIEDAEVVIASGVRERELLAIYRVWLKLKGCFSVEEMPDTQWDAVSGLLRQVEAWAAEIPAHDARTLAVKIHMTGDISMANGPICASVVDDLKRLTNGEYSHD